MPTLKAENLARSKDDGTQLFRDVSFSVADGEILVIRGPSGVGKSTMLRCIAQLDELDDGTLTLDGRTPEDFGIPTWRTRVAYVPQRPATLPGTPFDFYERVCSFAAQQQRLKQLVASRSTPATTIDVGLQWNLGETAWRTEWSRLSGGEAQRAALAIAVALEPDILLLDEPTSALDPETCQLVEATLLGRVGGCVWITHDPAQAERVATRILTMKRPVEGGTSAEIHRASSAYYGTFSSTTDCIVPIDPSTSKEASTQ
ncbi:P-loop containing nucleoside triphosphate hydrolase protein [Syncephalis pseudoplumigaleata]|uniref:P-loop containing nucleoside triphosphate hydrolase protein n=1 Tax=Syncephalis pseudoplumigaleata TaxID=1712513 RepID=A0A4P9YYS5_9FUNG|nr:P-loop containing nucleoside triphosphate hydrolase protein [Syncephalis pseudoplumigaleata]|eukprot:RKP25257.1 P-loop containing nucleoside triphosphate hydrolase protein [Syncephalis pseudoplumigaleata]